MFLRVAASLLLGMGLVFVSIQALARWHSTVFHSLAFVLYLHMLWLANANEFSTPYLVGFIVTTVCFSMAMQTERWLWTFSIVALVTPWIGQWDQLRNSRLLVAASLLTVSIATLLTGLIRFRYLRGLEFALSQVEQDRLKLLNATRLKAVGALASGISHEVNNPLMIIVGRIHQIDQEIEKEPLDRTKIKEVNAKVLDAVERIRKIVNSLRIFARPAHEESEVETDLNGIVRDVILLSRTRLSNHEIELRFALDESNPMALVRRGQVGQALIAILNNAFEAVRSQPERWIEVLTHATKEKVQIRVTDSGPGLPPHIQKRLFESFVPGSDPAQTSGVGLATARQMVQDSGGKIWLDTDSKNTRFILEFPRISS